MRVDNIHLSNRHFRAITLSAESGPWCSENDDQTNEGTFLRDLFGGLGDTVNLHLLKRLRDVSELFIEIGNECHSTVGRNRTLA